MAAPASPYGINDPYGLIASGLPPELAAEAMGLTRQQAVAQALLQQGMTPLQAPEVKGRFQGRVSPFEGIAKLAQSFVAGQNLRESDKGMASLGTKVQQNVTDTLLRSQQARAGSPAQAPLTPNDDEGNPMPGLPATSPNTAVANALLMNNPLTRQFGEQMMQRELEMGMVRDTLGRNNGGAPGGGPGVPGAPGMPGKPSSMPPLELLAAGPLGGSIFKALEERSKGIATRPGAPVVNPYTGEVIAQPTPAVPQNVQLKLGPDGPVASEVPGANAAAAASVAATTTAKESAAAPFDMVEVKMADGRMIKVPKSTLLGAAPAAPAQASPAQPRVASLEVTQPSKAPFMPPTVGGEPYRAPAPSADVWNSIPRRAVPQGQGQSTFDEGMAKQQVEAAGKLSDEFGAKAQAASQKTALNNQALDMVDKADTGTGAAMLGDIKNFLVSRVDIPEDRFENTPSATLALQKDLTQAATAKAKAQFGPKITQGEVNLMLSRGSPNTDMTKAAIKFLLQTDNAANQYDVQQANDFGKYVQSGGDPMKFGGWYAQAFPLTKALEGVKLDTSPQRRASDKTTLKFDAKGNLIQ